MGATGDGMNLQQLNHISIHAPLVGRDAADVGRPGAPRDFNPRAPRGARPVESSSGSQRRHISIHAPLVGRDDRLVAFAASPFNFNPRAPRGARHGLLLLSAQDGQISIHAPLVGRDSPENPPAPCAQAFQSTRPSWGATWKPRRRTSSSRHFNPHAPRGARPRKRQRRPVGILISIHAPLVGRD